MGFSSHQKIGAAIQQLGYGFAANAVDQYFRMSESSAISSFTFRQNSSLVWFVPNLGSEEVAIQARQIALSSSLLKCLPLFLVFLFSVSALILTIIIKNNKNNR
jgi:hypothetical protein